MQSESGFLGDGCAPSAKDLLDLLDDDTWAEVEVLLDDAEELILGHLAGTVVLNEQRQWLGNTDGVRDLHVDTHCSTSRFKQTNEELRYGPGQGRGERGQP